MPSPFRLLTLFLCGACAVAAEPATSGVDPATAAELVAVPPSGPSPLFDQKLEKAVADFEAKDRTTPPAQGTIEFIGSSTFTRWKSLVGDFAPLPVYNRGFGGSRVEHVLAATPRIVIPYHPAVIVYYCGDNNLHAPDKADPTPIAKGFTDFATTVHATLPATRIIYVSIKPSPRRRASWSEAQAVNTQVRDFCATAPWLRFVDISPALLDAHGEPKAELYVEDKLHLTAVGYADVTAILKPVVSDAWAAVKTSK